MRAAWLIALKDLRRSVRDRSALAVAIVAPLALAFILTSVLPDDEFSVNYGYVIEDTGAVGRVFSEQVLDGVARDFAKLREVESRAQAMKLAKDNEIAAAFIIPAGFSDDVATGRGGTVEVIGNPVSEVGAPVARAIAEGFVRELNYVALSVATTAAGSNVMPTEAGIAEIREQAASVPAPVKISQNAAESREFDTNTFFAAGMAVFFLFFTVQLGATGLLRERREGTLARLSAAPISRASILAGKGIFTFVLAISSMTVLILVTSVLLGASFGDWRGVAAVVVAAVLAGMGVQSLVTAISRTDEQAAALGSIVAVTLGLLGGTFFPLSQAPGFIARLSYATPHAWIMRALGDLSGGGAPLSAIGVPILALGMFAAVTIVAALMLIRRRGLVA